MSTPIAASGTYTVDASHSRVGFVARHMMVSKVRGSFNDFVGSGVFDADNPAASTLSITIQAASIDTRNADRDAHLRSNDFFDMDAHPAVSFASTGVSPVDQSNFKVMGDLTLRGVTLPVTFDVEVSGNSKDPYGNIRLGLEGSTTINRKDWGLNWNAPLETGGVVISEKITLEFEISAIKNVE